MCVSPTFWEWPHPRGGGRGWGQHQPARPALLSIRPDKLRRGGGSARRGPASRAELEGTQPQRAKAALKDLEKTRRKRDEEEAVAQKALAAVLDLEAHLRSGAPAGGWLCWLCYRGKGAEQCVGGQSRG